ncbi:hypothetical protein BC332_16204 [Capsicum chinense]|nr:hypothetical protein BC332_16204 [Capsicum chinense]
MLALHTTHTPNFLGLQQNGGVWQESNYGRSVIIGLLNSGITSDHPSFHDNNMPPLPAKWKGKCEFTGSVTCNNKLIGARNLLGSGSSDPPFDYTGHGTHTSSMAAGNFVDRANIFGNANGSLAGMAPFGHIAMYKVCTEGGCEEADMVAAIEAAIHDGVDVISGSIGGFHRSFHEDYIAVGSFAAMRNGIIVVTSARKIIATIVLENGESYEGQSLFQLKDLPPTLFPLVYSQEIDKCEPKSLKNTDVRGKIVVCDSDKKTPNYCGHAVKDAGGVAMIFVNPKDSGDTIFEIVHVLPATIVGSADGEKIKVYVTSSSTASAGIVFKVTKIGFKDAPSEAYFSSRVS